VVLLYGNLGQVGQLTALDRLVLRVTGQLQRGIMVATTAVVQSIDRYLVVWNLEARNETLRREHHELRENNEILKVWARDGLTLERELGFTPTPELRMLPAVVVGRGPSPFFQVLRIRREHGGAVRPGLAVAVPEGLVGRVRRTYGSFADVLLVDDAESRVKVAIPRSGAEGDLRGLGRGGILGGRIGYLTPRDEVRVGDAVVTSGMDGVYPKDLHVGEVTAIRRRVPGQYQAVEVRMRVDLATLPRVYLVVPEVTRPTAPTKPASERRAP
jgi:rod shape-determining protein MreC